MSDRVTRTDSGMWTDGGSVCNEGRTPGWTREITNGVRDTEKNKRF